MNFKIITFVLWAGVVVQPLFASEVREPEATAAKTQKHQVRAEQMMAVTANPYASEAAYSILLQGGSAIDAAIAAQLVLNLVEPQSSGIGGGAFALWYDAREKQVAAWDGRETAPAAATATRFVTDDGRTMGWWDALVGGRSVGVPGLVALMQQMHQAYGKMPWRSLFVPAIRLAEQGFIVSPRLHYLLAEKLNPGLLRFRDSADYFYPGGKPLAAGQRVTSKAFANTLKTIAKLGAQGFYQGRIARAMVDKVQDAAVNPGDLAMPDLANYRVVKRKPLCRPFREYSVCGMPLPSSGGMTVSQILTMWQPEADEKLSNLDEAAVHQFTQISRLAYADRNHYLADDAFVEVPVNQLLDNHYLQQRRQLVTDTDMQKALPGEFGVVPGESATPELPSTTHLTIIDADGNAISMTSSIEMGFGSGLMSGGFLLNNQLTDFSLSPERDGKLVANRVQPGKRPLSSMSPTIVLREDGELQLVVGSPGGSRIIQYVAQSLIMNLDEQVTLQQAFNTPHVTNRNDYTALEKGTGAIALRALLEQRGHEVRLMDLNSGLHGIERCGELWCGAADPRREGVAMGR